MSILDIKRVLTLDVSSEYDKLTSWIIFKYKYVTLSSKQLSIKGYDTFDIEIIESVICRHAKMKSVYNV